jgi:uncharacterized damage-inducible protein DinB
MITPQQLAEAYGRNVAIVKMQTQGMTHAESVAPLPINANCMNWTLGHMLDSRNAVLRLLGEEPALPPELAARYARDGEPITPGEEVVPLEELLAALDRAQERIVAALGQLTEEQWSREVALTGRTARPVSFWLLFLYFHDTFHAGETSVLRQAHGKADKVI